MRSILTLALVALVVAGCASQPFQQPGSGGATTYTFTPTIVIGSPEATTKPTTGPADAHHSAATTATGGAQTPTADVKPNVNIPAAGGAVIPPAPPEPVSLGSTISAPAPGVCTGPECAVPVAK